MAGLLNKGMVQHETHHHMLKKTVDGVTQLVTKMSHDGKEISETLAMLMARQCCLRTAEFWNLIDCPLSGEAWDELVAKRCADGRNPFIGR